MSDRYLPLADRNQAAHMLLRWVADRDPDLVQDAVKACRDVPAVAEVARDLLVAGRAAVTRRAQAEVTP